MPLRCLAPPRRLNVPGASTRRRAPVYDGPGWFNRGPFDGEGDHGCRDQELESRVETDLFFLSFPPLPVSQSVSYAHTHTLSLVLVSSLVDQDEEIRKKTINVSNPFTRRLPGQFLISSHYLPLSSSIEWFRLREWGGQGLPWRLVVLSAGFLRRVSYRRVLYVSPPPICSSGAMYARYQSVTRI